MSRIDRIAEILLEALENPEPAPEVIPPKPARAKAPGRPRRPKKRPAPKSKTKS